MAVTETVHSVRSPLPGDVPPEIADQIRQALRGLKYGQVALIVQAGHVVQVHRTQQRRVFQVRHNDS
jgi:hypothetical protein